MITIKEYLKKYKGFNTFATREDMITNPALSEEGLVGDKDIEDKVITFLKENPNPKDEQVHQLAKDLKVDTDELESVFYKVATKVGKVKMLRLKHSEDPDSDFDEEQLKMGTEIEKEHVDFEEIAKAIAKAHLSEIPDYYTRLKKMEAEAKK